MTALPDMHGMLLLLHVLVATIWTGGHIVLSTVVLPRVLKERAPAQLLRFEAGYEKVGIPALLVQVVTGLLMAQALLGDAIPWFDFSHPLSRLVSIKLMLLALTVAFAADARLRLIPKLSVDTLPALAWHVIPVTIVSILFVIVGVAFRTGWFG